MTALIALENADLNEVIKVGNRVYQVPLDASKAGHNPGDEITLKDLVTSYYCLLATILHCYRFVFSKEKYRQ